MKSAKPTAPPYQCAKTRLRNVIRNPNHIPILIEVANKMSVITTHTLQFLKLYLLHCYDSTDTLPKLSQSFIEQVMKVVSLPPKTASGAPPSEVNKQLLAQLRQFYDEHYTTAPDEPSQNAYKVDYVNMTQIFQYSAIEIITAYENNIRMRFADYVARFVNVVNQQKELLKYVGKNSKEGRAFSARLRRFKNYIMRPDVDVIPEDAQYEAWIREQRRRILPNRPIEKNSVYFDIKCTRSPQDYLRGVFYMMKAVEACKASVFNVCPLHTTLIPGHFRMDTVSLIKLLGKNKKLTDITGRNASIWNELFKTNKSCFHLTGNHAYTFDHQIITDGVSCTIQLVRKDLAGKLYKPKSEFVEVSERYIDQLTSDEYKALRGMKIVAIDPNKSDLMHCVNSDDKTQTKFRYTQNQRRFDTKAKRYRDIIK